MSSKSVTNLLMDQTFTDYYIICDGCGLEIPSPVSYTAVTPSSWKEVVKPAVWIARDGTRIRIRAMGHDYCPECAQIPEILEQTVEFGNLADDGEQ